ncbi:MAG: hypothetical protein Q7Q71_14415 [Verrucomicrobiota bacterium JB023]|nr:hypothetical protein [Verrucomicrobiota bacterium JB023]
MSAQVLLFLLASSLSLIAGQFPDGVWNSKPWPADKLEAEAAAGNIDAMAEWAFCSSEVMLGIAYDSEQIVEYAKRSSTGGSALGTLLLGEFYIRGQAIEEDQAKGSELIIQAAETGHPLARYKWASLMVLSDYVGTIEPDPEAALEIFEEPGCKQLFNYDFIDYLIYSKGARGFQDFEEAYSALIRCFNKTQSIDCASNIIYLNSSYDKPARKYLTDAILNKAAKRVEEGVRLNHPHAKYRWATYKKSGITPHQKFPLLIEAANQKTWLAHYTLNYWVVNQDRMQQCGGEVLIGDGKTRLNTAAAVYEKLPRLGKKSRIGLLYAEKIRDEKQKNGGGHSAEDEAIQIYRQLIRADRSNVGALRDLGNYFCYVASFGEKRDKKYLDRGCEMFVYLSEKDRRTAFFLVATLLNSPHFEPQYAKAYAALDHVWDQKDSFYSPRERRLKRKMMEKITPEQIAEGERLIKDGYPYARKYREAAFKFLQEKGDVPADWIFDDDLDEHRDQMERGDAHLFDPRFNQILLAAITTLPVLETDPTDSSLLFKLTKGEDFTEKELPHLTRLLIAEEERLFAALAELPEEHRAKLTERIENAIAKEDQAILENNPLQARFLWFLYCHDDYRVSSRPIIGSLAEGGLGAMSNLQVGDVIKTVHGVDLESDRSRNLLVRLLELWPQEEKLDLVVLRAKHKHISKSLINYAFRTFPHEISIDFTSQ